MAEKARDIVVPMVSGSAGAGARAYAQAKFAALAHYAHEPVLAVQVRVERSATGIGRTEVRAVVDVSGRVVHVRATAPSARGAIDTAWDRAREQIIANKRDWDSVRGRAGRIPTRTYRRRVHAAPGDYDGHTDRHTAGHTDGITDEEATP